MTQLPLAAMPNAGMPRAVEGRNIYLASPEYMASFARKFVKAGATFVGGCCGTTPTHIRAMKSALRAMEAHGDERAGDGCAGSAEWGSCGSYGSGWVGEQGGAAAAGGALEDWGDGGGGASS